MKIKIFKIRNEKKIGIAITEENEAELNAMAQAQSYKNKEIIKRSDLNQEALQAGITKYNLDGDTLSVTGKECRFENVKQERTLLYHIAEGVEVEENSAGWNLYRDKELVAVVSVEGDADFEINI